MAFYPVKELIDQVFGAASPKALAEDYKRDDGLDPRSMNSGTYINPSTFFSNNPEGEELKTPIGIFCSQKPVKWGKKTEKEQKIAENTIIQTGFPGIDNLLGELKDDSLTLIAGLPGVGKSSLALNIAEHAAADADLPVAFFSLDIEREELLSRLVSARSRVTLDSIYSGFIVPSERDGLNAALEDLYQSPIYIDDACHSLASIKEGILACKDKMGLRLIVIDCMQLITGKDSLKNEKALRQIGFDLKALAAEISVPIIATYQLPQSWQNKKVVPHPSFIVKRGAAEHYSADKLILVYRRGVCRECHNQIELCTCALDLDTRLVVAHGATQQGVAHLRFLSSSVHFETPPPAVEQNPLEG